MRTATQNTKVDAGNRTSLEKLFFEVQRDRVALTSAIMQLRGSGMDRRQPRLMLKIIVALLRLQRANRRAMAALGLSKLS